MVYKRKKNSLPSPDSKTFLQKVKEILETREGVRSSRLMAFVTRGELHSMKLGGITEQDTNDAGVAVVDDGYSPEPPTNLSVETNFLGNELSWDASTSKDVWYYEVWVNTAQDRSGAEFLATVSHPKTHYYHSVKAADVNTNHYYWVRAIDWSGYYSEWEPNDDQGGYLASGNASLSEVTKEMIDSLKLSDKSVNHIAGQLSGGDYYLGGITQDGTTNQNFIIMADTFRVLQPDSGYDTPKQPFIIGSVDGTSTVGIDGQLVVDGSIYAESVAADNIKAKHLDGAEVFVNTIQSSNYSAGSTGWQIDHSTDAAEFNDIAIVITSGTGALNLDDGPAESGATDGATSGTNLKDSGGSTLGDSDVVTNQGTANDTDNVSGTSASTVEDGASRANSGLNSSGELFNVAAPTTNVGTPGSSGLYLGADALGYFDGGSWTAYIDDSGHFYFTGDSNNFVQWDGSNLTWSGSNASLNSSGNLVVSTIEITSLEDGADVTADHPDSVVFTGSTAPSHKAGKVWFDTSVNEFKRSDGSSWTIVSDITSNHSQDLNWITDSGSLTISSGSITISASETFTISADEGMVIATGGGIKFKGHDSSSALLKFVGATDPDYIYKFGANDSCTLCCMWSEDSIGGGSSTTDLYFGYSVADTFSNTENLPFYRVRINASYSIDFDGVAIAHDDLKPYSNAAYDNGTNSNAWNYIWGNILGLLTQSSEPSDPPYSSGVQWIDDGTVDSEGALLYKYTDGSGTTTTYRTDFTTL